MWYRYGSVLLRSTLLATLLCLASYEQCSTLLLKMLHKHCNTDVLGVLLIYPHSLSGTARPRDHAYISVKPLPAVLQPINVCMYISRYVCTYVYVCMYVCVRMYVCVYVCMYVCIYECTVVYIYVHVSVRTYVHVCMYVCIYVCNVCIRVYVLCLCVCSYTCTFILTLCSSWSSSCPIDTRQCWQPCFLPWPQWHAAAKLPHLSTTKQLPFNDRCLPADDELPSDDD